MTTLRHGYNNPQPDDGDPDVTGPDEWNDDHVSDHAFVMVGSIPASLTGARSLAVSGGFLSLTDAGALGAITVGLTGLPASAITGGQALTRTNDTNVTLTLGGTPGSALLTAVSMTLGWTGLLGLARGGTHADLSGTGGAGQYLKQVTAGADITVGTIPASDIGSGAALTRVNDTNVTATLGGTPASALLVATSITLGWTGTLAVGRGGTGVGALGDITRVNDTNVTLTLGGTPVGAVITSTSFTLGWTGVLGLARGGTHADLSATGGAGQYLKQITTGADITVGTIPASEIVSGAALTRVNDTNVTVTLGGTPASALLAATSMTLGWSGTLAVGRGGTGVGALGDITRVNDTNVTLTLGGTPAGAVITSTSFTLGWSGQLGLARGGTHADLSATGGTSQYLKQASVGADITVGTIAAADLPGTFSGFANPTASVGLSVVNGSATTAMRSDGAPPLSQAINPTWTGNHTFSYADTTSSALEGIQIRPTYLTASGTLATAVGMLVSPTFRPATGATITTAVGVQNTLNLGGVGTTGTVYAYRINSPGYSGAGRATTQFAFNIQNFGVTGITTAGAIDIEAQSGATTNFGIRNASNMVQTGYARFGAITVPSNVTDGDVTLIRAFGTTADMSTGYRIGGTATSTHYLRGNGTNYVDSAILAGDLPGSFSGFANPTGTIGLATVNGSATTAMRSDAAPPLSQAITPTWTGLHLYSGAAVRMDQYLRVGSTSAPATTSAGYISAAAILVGTDKAFPGETNGLIVTTATPGGAAGNVFIDDISAMAAGIGGRIVFGGRYLTAGASTSWAAIQGQKEDGTSGNFGGNLILQPRANSGSAFVDVAGAYASGSSFRVVGYERVGSLAAPTNVAAGDLTATRGFMTTSLHIGGQNMLFTTNPLQVHALAGDNFVVAQHINLSNGFSIQSLNDAGTLHNGVEIFSSQFRVNVANVECLTVYSGGNIGFGFAGGTAPSFPYEFRFSAAARLMLRPNNTLADGVLIQSDKDAYAASTGMEFWASKFLFSNGPVNVATYARIGSTAVPNNVTAGDFTAARGQFGTDATLSTGVTLANVGYFTTYVNSQTRPGAAGEVGLAVGWNYSGGSGEVGLWNMYTAGTPSFSFKQKTGASTHNELMTLDSVGRVGIGGATIDANSALTLNGTTTRAFRFNNSSMVSATSVVGGGGTAAAIGVDRVLKVLDSGGTVLYIPAMLSFSP